MILSPASAAITINNSPGAVQPPEEVLLADGTTGQTVFGQTNQTHTDVSFQSTNGSTLEDVANGQARVQALNGSLNGLTLFLTDGGLFSQIEFDLHKADDPDGSVAVIFNGTFAGGTTSRAFDVGSGNNWFSAATSGGDLISSVSFTGLGTGFADIRQIRLGGITAAATAAVPEPASWAMMLCGFGLAGTALRRRRNADAVFG